MPAPENSIPLVLAMLLVFGSAKIMGEICERAHLPGLVGEILAGVVIGPGVLGWVAPSAALTALSDLGVMFLLFNVGLEVKASELMRVGATAFLVATAGVVLPFLVGCGILVAWGAPHAEAIFVGATMVATSVGITASILSGRGLLDEIASKIILTAAVIDDVLGLIVLAAVSAIARGHLSLLDLILTAMLAAGFTIVVGRWGTTVVNRFLPRFRSRARGEESEFHVSIVLLFGLALLAQYTGIAAIVGAFLAGLALADTAHQRVRDLTKGVTELLVPFFLVGVGLRFDMSVLRSQSTLLLALIVLAAAILTKFIGCGLGAMTLGWKNAVRVGLGMVPRGEVGMVVAQLGLSMAVITMEIYSVLVFMVLATTVMTPLLLKIAYRDEDKGVAAKVAS